MAATPPPVPSGNNGYEDVIRVRTSMRTCILFALPQERKALRWKDTPTLTIAVSGTGAANAARATDQILRAAHPNLLIICGFAGALRPGMHPGDLVIATHVIGTGPDGTLLPQPLEADPEATRLACDLVSARAGTHVGTLYSAPRVLLTAKEKARCASQTGADAVDMETAAAAAIATRYGVSWISVRSVTDDATADLPLDFNAVTGADGNTSMKLLLMELLRKPSAIPGLLKLGKGASAAAAALEQFLKQLIPAIEMEPNASAKGK